EVKVIDFGIAKAANKGSKTQAGILKGKFGYMSPEQVRGIPIDRRSDVFSCGIVLYEMLTGERLFVGESDFSTLEKVRNVEILPPSTYNRKIPDELERIVLKALAKDVEDRYQNAIDLHDELQAFVYTAGEFYSRKDLAGWMKKTFGKEIEEETAKLESYRQLKPPAPEAPAVARTSTGERKSGPVGAATPPPVKRTMGMPAVGPNGTKPPPPPARASGQIPVVSPVVTAKKSSRSDDDSGGLAWDDDELETQIYDNPEEEAAARSRKQAAAGPGVDIEVVTPPPEPDLSTLVSPSASWPAAGSSAPMAARGANGANGHGPTNGAARAPRSTPPGGVATSSAAASKPSMSMGSGSSMPMPAISPGAIDPRGSEARMATATVFETSMGFGSGVLEPRSRSRAMLWAGLGGAALIAGAIVVVLVMSGGDDKAPAAAPSPVPAAPTVAGVGSLEIVVTPAGISSWRLDGQQQNLRFPVNIKGLTAGKHQIAVDAPPGFMSTTEEVDVKADDTQKISIDLSPLDVVAGFESTPPGAHVAVLVGGQRIDVGETPTTYKIDPRQKYEVVFEKDGYVSVNRPLALTGAAEEKVAVALERANAVAMADHPAGGTGPVTVPDHGEHGEQAEHVEHVDRTGPVEHPGGGVRTGGPGQRPGGGPVDRPGGDHGGGDHPGGAVAIDHGGDHPAGDHGGGDHGGDRPGGDHVAGGDHPAGDHDGGAAPAAKGEGTLMLGSKPPCEIFIDGRNTGLRTPQREIKLPAGHHKITLLNNDFSIKESFSVDIDAGGSQKMVKDFSDRIPQ
ncbi:MAG TPA: PEGA domain-containing protein, partial [Kofleriaceae bacterium]|nr:PEGA domain-containing protein [Kofleriaceae bacterium]